MMLMKIKNMRLRLKRIDTNRQLNRDGFTLVEIMMVLFILTVGILPLAVIQHRARHDVTKSDLHTQGITVAQDQLERMKGLGFGNAVPEVGTVGSVDYATSVTNVSFGLNRLEVTVTWLDGGDNNSITLADMVSMR